MTAVVIRFSNAGPGVVSPVVIRFEGDEPQPVPIQEPNIIMAVGTGFTSKVAQHGQAHKTTWRSGNDLTNSLAGRWSSNPAIIKQTHPLWTTTPILTQQSAADWGGNWPTANQHLLAGWGGYQQVVGLTKTSWMVGTVVGYKLLANWQASVDLKQSLNTQAWQHTDVTETFINLFYCQVGDITQANKLRWGPRPPSYICSNDARPTKGTVTIRFNTPGETTSGVVSVRFSNDHNPVVCELDIGSGLIPPLPDLPTVDTSKPITPPRRRAYVMQPELRCYRTSDNTEVNITSVSFSISRSQWGATIGLVCGSKGDKDLLFANGVEQEFKLLINGYEFYGLAESPSLSHSHGSTQHTVTGRSSIALLDRPHANARTYSNTQAKGIAALVSDELTGTGWTLDFGMTQFNVPAGAFNYINKTPIEAIAQIATAIGGMLYPEGSTKTLKLRAQWPVTPWAIASATPDVAVHDDVILAYSSNPASTPLYNAVFVRGEQQGVEGKVRRTGTAGDVVAPDVVDPLITDNLAARQRGTAELSNSGKKDAVQLVLPIMDTLPPVLPGSVVGVLWQTENYKALADTLTITATKSADGQLSVRQNVGVLRSYE